MTRYYQQPIKREIALGHDTTQLAGGKPMRKQPFSETLAAQDRVIGMGRRVLFTLGAQGAKSWWSIDLSSITGTAQELPEDGVERSVFLWIGTVSPGCKLACNILYVPSGPVETNPSGSDWRYAGATGQVKLEITWLKPTDIATTLSSVHRAQLPGSTLPQGTMAGKYPTGDGEGWGVIREARITNIWPTGAESSLSVLGDYVSEGVIAAITVKYIGACRVLDLCVYEEPWKLAMEADADPVVPAHLANAASSLPVPRTSSDFPVQRRSETTPDGDPRLGTWHMQNVDEQQIKRLGPQLMAWCAWEEGATADTGISLAATGHSVSVTSTSFVHLLDSGIAYQAQTTGDAGWLVGCGYSRRLREADPVWLPATVVPVVVWVFTLGTYTGGTARVETTEESYVDVTLATGTWASARGYLRIGKSASQAVRLDVWVKVATGTAEVIAVCVERQYRRIA